MADKDKNVDKKKKEKEKKRKTTKRSKKKDFLRADKNDLGTEEETDTPKKPDGSDVASAVSSVKCETAAAWCQATLAKSHRKICREFVENKKIKPAAFTTEAYEKNDAKNRYNDIQCTDATRVILKDRPSDEDYIHANWMSLPDNQKYICTQGPLSETLEDFWHMLFTEKSNVVIQLCSQFEGKNEKCARYWPKAKGASEEFGMYKVTLKEKKADPFDTITYQILECEAGGKSLLVHHLATPSWPDHSAPDSPVPMVGILKLAKKVAAGAPITVHCSAGIGRTSTFVGIDLGIQKIKEKADASMVDVLRELRAQRFHSIQSAMQYLFMHLCILEYFADEGALPRKGKYQALLDSYAVVLKKYAAKVAPNDKEDK